MGLVHPAILYTCLICCSALLSASCAKDEPATKLSPSDYCAVEVLRARGLEGDVCLADCIERGGGKNIGGGCHHVCFAYSTLEWPEAPAGPDSCEALADAP